MSTYLYISLIKPRKYNLSGETDANKNGLIQGQSNTPLSKIGIEQAKKIGEKFSSTKFDVAIFDVAIFKKKLGQRMDNEWTTKILLLIRLIIITLLMIILK